MSTKRNAPISRLTALGIYSRLVGRAFNIPPVIVGEHIDLFAPAPALLTLCHMTTGSIPTPEDKADEWAAIDAAASEELSTKVETVFSDGVSTIRVSATQPK